MQTTTVKTTRNAFALLQEESTILRRKEKRLRALERKARREAEAATSASVPSGGIITQVPCCATLIHGQSWADVVSDDDDEEEETAVPAVGTVAPGKEDLGLEAYLSSDSAEEGEEEEDDAETDVPVVRRAGEATNSQNGATASHPAKNLSKKEKTQQELVELDELLNSMGLAEETAPSAQLHLPEEVCGDQTGVLLATTLVPVTATGKAKKKKAKKATGMTTDDGTTRTSTQEALPESSPGTAANLLTREEALAALSRRTGAKKKNAVGSSSLPATVLSEAKKKAEIAEVKKAKQKKEKHMFNR